MRDDPATQAYLAGRRKQGKSDREIRRCLKRPTAILHPHRSDDPNHGGQHLMPPRTDSHDRRNHAKRS
jgi:hypothetical protein